MSFQEAKAADQGDATAQGRLGVAYSIGLGVPKDYAQAVHWSRKAADQGDATGQHNLGSEYSIGRGVPKDYAQAVHWFRKAADQGDANGYLLLGAMYHNGTGVPQDYVTAHKWYNLAASVFPASEIKQRNNAVAHRDRVAALMTPVQIAEAQRLAREWTPTGAK